MSAPLVVATRNAGKLRELMALLVARGYEPVDLAAAGLQPSADEDALEDGATFEENALSKARHFHRRAGGRAVLADDSGLSVVALGGAPGVHSRRWSGVVGSEAAVSAANNALLLERLGAREDRRAEFVCAAALVTVHGAWVCRGVVRGTILNDARGARGFGYDPLFLSDELGKTFAEATQDEKNRVSHRARAVAALMALAAGA